MLTNERSVELAQNHVCAFSNTMDEEHRCLARSTKVVSTGLKVASLDRHLRLQAAAKAFVQQPVVDRRASPRGNHTKGAPFRSRDRSLTRFRAILRHVEDKPSVQLS
jgi:hypothetical protein